MINSKYKKFMERNNIQEKCELCGSTRSLEIHHLLPKVLVGERDEDINLICICEACHQKITPRRLLVRTGIRQALAPKYLSVDFYNRVKKKVEDGCCGAADVMDAFDEFIKENFGDKKTPFACFYRGCMEERPKWDGF